MISVIVATKNRPDQIIPCILSIKKNTKVPYEIIICDQSHTQKTYSTTRTLSIRYSHVPRGGKSAALNKGIELAQYNILAFTDDDCIADEAWLTHIAATFKQNKGVAGIFGKTLPYHPQKHKGLICPSTFNGGNKKKHVTTPSYHARHIGYGNNMAFRRKVLKKLGGFKTWLGPGSIGSNAEDAELALRVLIGGHTLQYNPSVTVYHNKWLSNNEMRRQNLSYVTGELACYTYFFMQGNTFAAPVLRDNLKNSIHLLKTVSLSGVFPIIIARVRGFLIGIICALIDPTKYTK